MVAARAQDHLHRVGQLGAMGDAGGQLQLGDVQSLVDVQDHGVAPREPAQHRVELLDHRARQSLGKTEVDHLGPLPVVGVGLLEGPDLVGHQARRLALAGVAAAPPGVHLGPHQHDAVGLNDVGRLLQGSREHCDGDRPGEVFELHPGHHPPAAVGPLADLADDAADADLKPLELGRDLDAAGVGAGVQLRLDPPQGMVAEVDAEELALPGQPGAVVGGNDPIRQPHFGLVAHRPIAKQRHLAGSPVQLDRLGAVDETVQAHQQLLPLPQRIHRPALDQRLQHALVDLVQVEPQAEVEQRLVRTGRLALLDDQLDGLDADVLDALHAVGDRVAHDRERRLRRVDVRWGDLDAVVLAVDHDRRDPVLVLLVLEQTAEVLDRVVGLEVGGLVGDHPVRRGVGFVEAVAGEDLDQVEDRLPLLLGDAVGDAAGYELLPLPGHLGLVLLAHGGAQDVGLPHREARQQVGDRHHLLLVDDDAIRLPKRVLQRRVGELRLHGAVLAGDVAVDHAALYGTRSIEGDYNRDVLELARAQRGEDTPHPRRFQLEHAQGVAPAQHLKRSGVIQRQRLQVDADTAGALNQLDAGVDDVEVAQPQEVHLQQPELLDRRHLVLGDGGGLVGGTTLQRCVLDNRLGRNDNTGGVGADTASDALETACGVDKLPVALVRFIDLPQLGDLLHRLLQADSLALEDRHHLGDRVDLGDGHVEHPADVADRGLTRHGAESADLSDTVLAVFLRHVFDHRLAPGHREVDVDVGHGDAILVEETLEEKPVAQRLESGDVEAVGHH